MIAVDTNILVHAHRQDSPWHAAAEATVRFLAQGSTSWAIPWPCVHEFLAIVTHPKIFKPPTPQAAAHEQVAAWLKSPSVVTLGEGPGYWDTLTGMLHASKATGPIVHDARIAALCTVHRVTELWTADRDFSRFPAVSTRNPLVG